MTALTVHERYTVSNPAFEIDVPIDPSVADTYLELLQSPERPLFASMSFEDIVGRLNDTDYPCALQRLSEDGMHAPFQPYFAAVMRSPQVVSTRNRLADAYQRDIYNTDPVGLSPADVAQVAHQKAESFILMSATRKVREHFEPYVQSALIRETTGRIVEGARLLDEPEHDRNVDLLATLRGSDVEQVLDIAKAVATHIERVENPREYNRLALSFAAIGVNDDRLIDFQQGMNVTPVSVTRLKEMCLDAHVQHELSQQNRFRRSQSERIVEKYRRLYAAIGSELPDEIPTRRVLLKRTPKADTEPLRTRIADAGRVSHRVIGNASAKLKERVENIDKRTLARVAVGSAATAIIATTVAQPASAEAATSGVVLTSPDAPVNTELVDASRVLPNLGKAAAPATQLDKAPQITDVPDLQPVSSETLDALNGSYQTLDLSKVATVVEHKVKTVRHESGDSKKAFRDHVVALANKNPDAVDGHKLADWIEKYAEEHGSEVITKELVTSVLWKESNFNPKAKNSRSGAAGMAQFMPGTAKEVGLDNPYNPKASVEAAFKYLRRMEAYVERLHPHASVAEKQRLSLAAYNAGPGNVKKYGGIPPFSETRDYVRKITKHTSEIQAEQGKKRTVTEVTTGLTLDMPADTTPDAVTAEMLVPADKVLKTTDLPPDAIAAPAPETLPEQAPQVVVAGQTDPAAADGAPVQHPDGSVTVAAAPPETDEQQIAPALVIPPIGPIVTLPSDPATTPAPETTPVTTIPGDTDPIPALTLPNQQGEAPSTTGDAAPDSTTIPSTEDGTMPVTPTPDAPSDRTGQPPVLELPALPGASGVSTEPGPGPATPQPEAQAPDTTPETSTPDTTPSTATPIPDSSQSQQSQSAGQGQAIVQPQADQIIQLNPEDLQPVPLNLQPDQKQPTKALDPSAVTTINPGAAPKQPEQEKKDKQLPKDIAKDVQQKVESGKCPKGTTTLGVYKISGGKSMLCAVRNLPSSSAESRPGNQYYVKGADGHAIIEQELADNLQKMVADAAKDGVTLKATSSFRTFAHQEDLWDKNGHDRNVVAPPGHSMHNAANAVDFDLRVNRTKDCVTVSGICTSPNDEDYDWLVKNAGKYGFGQYYKEAWHWDTLKSHWAKR